MREIKGVATLFDFCWFVLPLDMAKPRLYTACDGLTSYRGIQQLHHVNDRNVASNHLHSLLQLQQTAWVAGSHSVRPSRKDVLNLARSEFFRRPGTNQVVDAGRSATECGLGNLEQLKPRDCC